eukprot:TRINITY_DN6693_c0_g1_i1.p1 TRINITY_DN6693_c0_g1~~TRINITY_DN6693_c0_g1_i1.p1  ORF type:complete len:654 (-),score=124.78 TRINITY_DN6693_c0_g1_i1:21-1982(-)
MLQGQYPPSFIVFIISLAFLFIYAIFKMLNMGEVVDVFMENSLLKSGLVGSIVYFIFDQASEYFDQAWKAIAHPVIYKELIISTSEADNVPLYNKIAFYLVKNYRSRINSVSATVGYVDKVRLTTQGSDTDYFVDFTPSPGTFLIFFERKPIWISMNTSDLKFGIGRENKTTSVKGLHLCAFSWNSQILNRLVKSSLDYWDKHHSQETTTIKSAVKFYKTGQMLAINKRKTDLDGIILSEDVLVRVQAILQNFRDCKDQWTKQKLTHRESILFHGPPGNGKSLLVNYIAGYLEYDIYLLNLAGTTLDDERLLRIIAKIPSRSVIVIEEIDTVCPDRNLKDLPKKSNGKVSMAGILTALDGQSNKDGHIFVATTNRYHMLDPALTRKGRFNHHIMLDWPDVEQKERLFRLYYPNASDEEVSIFIDTIKGVNISCSTIVNYLREQVIHQFPDRNPLEGAINSSKIIESRDVVTRLDLDTPITEYLNYMEVSEEVIERISDLGNVREMKKAGRPKVMAMINQKNELSYEEKLLLKQVHGKLRKIRTLQKKYTDKINSSKPPILLPEEEDMMAFDFAQGIEYLNQQGIREYLTRSMVELGIDSLEHFVTVSIGTLISEIEKLRVPKLNLQQKLKLSHALRSVNRVIDSSEFEYIDSK